MSKQGQSLHKLEAAAEKKLRLALAAVDHEICALGSCDHPAFAVVRRWDGSFSFACSNHADEALRRGYEVRW
jgi:hypothetical protein